MLQVSGSLFRENIYVIESVESQVLTVVAVVIELVKGVFCNVVGSVDSVIVLSVAMVIIAMVIVVDTTKRWILFIQQSIIIIYHWCSYWMVH